MNKLKSAFVWSFVERYSSLVLQIASTLILARLLMPEEIGLASVGIGLVAILHSLRDFGVSNYIVQEKELTRAKLQTAFAISIFVSGLAFVVLLLCGQLAEYIFDEEGVGKVIIILSFSFLFLPLSAYKLALYKREMEFFNITRITLSADFIQNISVIIFAWYGMSYLSIPLAGLLGAVTTTALCLWFSEPGERLITPSLKEWRQVLPFTGMMSSAAIIKDIGIALPEMFIAKFMGFASAGIFSRAKGLTGLFYHFILRAVQPVALSFFSEQNRLNNDLGLSYIKSMAYLTAAAWPFFIFMGFNAHEVIAILFGEKWLAASPLLSVLCIGALFTVTSVISYCCLVAMGRVEQYMKLTLYIEVLKAVGIFFAAQDSMLSCVYYLGVVAVIEYLFYFYYLNALLRFNIPDYLRQVLFKAGVITLLSILPSFIAVYWLRLDLSSILLMIPVGIITLIIWLLSLYSVKHELSREITYIFIKLKYRMVG